ncbi:MAG: microcin C ABC transporter permease YejB [Candidatus Latescibacteria bacterium]|jgi:microcin C transport system permease protein|nr:microcin C ABC transporter permease YejB [Candidatus Latescibacterota bacterium]MBT5831171.1 microcin C ABC transporter permease YejB [Candidatus Latescibacterota bacterium]
MLAYILRRILLMFPTLLGVMLINFVIIQFVPGGPVEQMIATLQGTDGSATGRIGGGGGEISSSSSTRGSSSGGNSSTYRGAQGLDPALIAELEKAYGFDKPAHERFLKMVWDYARFDFGESFFRDQTVFDIVLSKMPVSISLGLWTTLLVYMISIPLGIAKAVRDGSKLDVWTSGVIVIGNAVPGFMFAIILIVLFSGGSYFSWFPLRGLTSPDWEQMGLFSQVVDYFWHLVLPVTAMVIGGFAGLTLLTKNSFLDEINKQYVLTARSKGLEERRVLYGHVFRNAMLIVIAGFPSAFVNILFTGSLLVEVIFSLDGLGLLGFESVVNRDYPVMLATLYFFTLLGLVMQLVSDITYMLVDPRIDFESREV